MKPKLSKEVPNNNVNPTATSAPPEESNAELVFEEEDVYEKLGIKRPKKGEENTWDNERIYKYYMDRDEARLRAHKGGFWGKAADYLEGRKSDVNFRNISEVRTLGAIARFDIVSKESIEPSWRETSKPYGMIAHKRYLEWVADLPAGPSEDEIKAKEQKKMDYDLWESIMNGKVDPPLKKKQLTRKERLEQEQMNKDKKKKEAEEELRSQNPRKYNNDRQLFHLNRKIPTESEGISSMEGWDVGVHFPYDLEAGFPQQDQNVEGLNASFFTIRDESEFAQFKPNSPKKSDKFIKAEGSVEVMYQADLIRKRLIAAEKYIRAENRKKEDEKRRLEKEEAKNMKHLEKEKEKQKQRNMNMSMGEGDETLSHAHSAAEGSEPQQSSYHKNLDDKSVGMGSMVSSIGDAGVGDDIQAFEKDAGGEDQHQPSAIESRMEEGYPMNDQNNMYEINQHDPLQQNLQLENSHTHDIPTNAKYTSRIHPTSGEDDDQSGLYSSAALSLSSLLSKLNPSKPPPKKLSAHQLRMRQQAEERSFKRKAQRFWETAKATIKYFYQVLLQVLSYLKIMMLAMFSTEYYLRIGRFFRRIGEALGILEEKKVRGIRNVEVDEGMAAQIAAEEAREKKRVKEEQRKIREIKRAKKMESLSDMDKIRYQNKINEEDRLEAEKEAEEEREMNLKRRQELMKKAAEDLKKQKAELYSIRGLIHVIWSFLASFGLLRPPPAFGSAAAEARKREEERQEKQRLADEATMGRIIDTMFFLREQQLKAETALQDQLDKMRGINRREDEELTPTDLVMAARAGNVNRVIDILQHPIHPIAANAVDEEGQTALYAALMMVLNNEAVDGEDGLKDDLMTCYEKIKLKITRCLKSSGQSAKLDLVIKILIYKGANIDWVREEKDGDGEGVLHVAAKRGAKSFISWMAKKRANIDIKTGRDKKTPLMFAAENNHLDAVFLLLREGAITSINATDVDGRTALHYAAAKATPQLCTVLLICGAKINARTNLGRLPLEEAETRGRTAVVVALRTYVDRTPMWKRRIEFYQDMYMPNMGKVDEEEEKELV